MLQTEYWISRTLIHAGKSVAVNVFDEEQMARREFAALGGESEGYELDRVIYCEESGIAIQIDRLT